MPVVKVRLYVGTRPAIVLYCSLFSSRHACWCACWCGVQIECDQLVIGSLLEPGGPCKLHGHIWGAKGGPHGWTKKEVGESECLCLHGLPGLGPIKLNDHMRVPWDIVAASLRTRLGSRN